MIVSQNQDKNLMIGSSSKYYGVIMKRHILIGILKRPAKVDDLLGSSHVAPPFPSTEMMKKIHSSYSISYYLHVFYINTVVKLRLPCFILVSGGIVKVYLSTV